MKQTAIIFILFIAGSLAIANERSRHRSRATGKQQMQRKHYRKDQKQFIQMQDATNTTTTASQTQGKKDLVYVPLGSLGDDCTTTADCFPDYRCKDSACWAKNCDNSDGCEGSGMVCSFGQCESYHNFWKSKCKNDDDCGSDAFVCNQGYCWGTACNEGEQVSGDVASDSNATSTPVTTPVTTALGGGDQPNNGDGPDDAGNCPAHQVCNWGKDCAAPMPIWQWCASFQSLCKEGLDCNECTEMCEFGQCQIDADCVEFSTPESPQSCFNGKCYTKVANGMSCEDNKQCHSDNCDLQNSWGTCVGWECDYYAGDGCEGAAWCNFGVCEVIEPYAGQWCATDEDCEQTTGKGKLMQCNLDYSQCFYQPAYGKVGEKDYQENIIQWECQETEDCGDDNKWCDYGNCEEHYTAKQE